jgi:hypothetical protein
MSKCQKNKQVKRFECTNNSERAYINDVTHLKERRAGRFVTA